MGHIASRLAVVVGTLGFWLLPAYSQDADHPSTEAQQTPDARDPILYSTETEHLKPLVTKLAKNVWMDEKEMWTSPLRIRSAEDALPWILVGAGTAALIASDHWTARQLPNTVDQLSISHDVSQLGAGYTVVPIAAGFYIGGAFAHNEKARETGILAGEAMIDATIVAEVFKLAT